MGPIEFLCDIRFHQTLLLPPNPEKCRFKPLRISYADFGDHESKAVVLFCGALMFSRFCYAELDQLAKENSVRIIHPDRPGIGGSEAVKLQERVSTWLEMIPHLLSHLQIEHISIASHSGGALYALNTLLTYPHILHPQHPYIAFFAPWVHQSHSGVTTMQLTSLLPSQLIGKYASFLKFHHRNIMPVARLSRSFIHGLRISSSGGLGPGPVAMASLYVSEIEYHHFATPLAKNRDSIGSTPDDYFWLPGLVIKYLFAESMDGISADAQLFLRKPSWLPWSEPPSLWLDIDSFVRLLMNRRSVDPDTPTLVVDTFHAEEDDMVGIKGRDWFDKCWERCRRRDKEDHEQEKRAGEEGHRQNGAGKEKVEYRSEIVEITDHNDLLDPIAGASEKWLKRVRKSFAV